MRILRNITITAVVIFLIAVAALIGLRLASGPTDRAETPAVTTPPTAPVLEKKTTGSKGGSWTATQGGFPVFIPENEDGEILTKDLASSEMETCDPMVNPRAPEETQIQQIHSRLILFTTTDGPSRIEDGLPVGYSHTPAGAATAFYNASVVVNPVNSPEGETSISQEAAKKLFSPQIEPLRVEDSEYSLDGAAFPVRVRVLACNKETVTIEVVNSFSPAGAPIVANRVQMVWRDNDWKVNLEAPTDWRKVSSAEVESWTRWKIG